MNSFLPGIVSTHLFTVTFCLMYCRFGFPNSKKNSLRGNYMRKYSAKNFTVILRGFFFRFFVDFAVLMQFGVTIHISFQDPKMAQLACCAILTNNQKCIFFIIFITIINKTTKKCTILILEVLF